MQALINSKNSLRLTPEEKQYARRQVIKWAKVELARRQFWYFCQYLDEDFFYSRPFLQNVAEELQEIHEGKIKSVSISMPPRAGKSYLVSIFCAWWLGKNPDKCVMRCTVTANLYNKFSYVTRDIIRSEKFIDVFPGIELSRDKQNINCWALNTSTQDAYFGGGVGTNIIGSGANLAITDDLYSGIEDARSEVYNQSLELWKTGSFDSRKERNCPDIDVGTRWSINDLIGKNIAGGNYNKIFIQPALIEDDAGKLISFCDAVKTTEEYLKIKSSILPEIFEAEYQQQPIEIEGILFPRHKLRRFRKSELANDGLEAVLGYCDVKDEGNDFLSAPFAKVYKEKCFITDVVFTQDTVDVTLPQTAALFRQLNCRYLRVEKNNQGGGFIRSLRQILPPDRILSVNHTRTKLSRIWDEYAFIMNSCYFLHDDDIEQGSPYYLFLKNLCAYMKDGSSKVDDAPDSMAGLARFIQSWPPTKALFPNAV